MTTPDADYDKDAPGAYLKAYRARLLLRTDEDCAAIAAKEAAAIADHVAARKVAKAQADEARVVIEGALDAFRPRPVARPVLKWIYGGSAETRHSWDVRHDPDQAIRETR